MEIVTRKYDDGDNEYYVAHFEVDNLTKHINKFTKLLSNKDRFGVGPSTEEATDVLKELYIEDCSKLIKNTLNLINSIIQAK